MFPELRNSYLHARHILPPRVINKAVDLAREKPTISQYDVYPPFNRVCSAQPCIPIPNCDVTRRALPFGRLAIKKLMTELHNKNAVAVKQALNSIGDLVHDPEYNAQAINAKVPNRMADLLLHEDPAIRENACIVLTTIAGLLDGKNAIVKNQMMLENITKAFHDPVIEVRMKACILLDRLSHVWMTADALVNNNFIEMIIMRLQTCEREDPCLCKYLRLLENLLYCNGKDIALRNNLFEILLVILKQESDPEVIGAALKDLSMLIETVEGKEKSLEYNVLKLLYKFIHMNISVIYENAACAMLLATIKSEAILKAIKLPKLIDRLFILAKSRHELTTQKYCLQIMANLCGHRKIKMHFIENYVQEIENLYLSHDPAAERVREILLNSLCF